MPRSREEAEALAKKLNVPAEEMDAFLSRQMGEAAPAVKVEVPKEDPKPKVEPKTKYGSLATDKTPKTTPPPMTETPKYAALSQPTAPIRTVTSSPVVAYARPDAYQEPPKPQRTGDPDAWTWLARGGWTAEEVDAALREKYPDRPRPEGPSVLPPVKNDTARRQVISDTMGLPGAAVYRPDAKADYDYLVGLGFTRESLDKVMADPAKGPAAIQNLAKMKREGK